MKYNICFTTGDPSADGHGIHEDHHMVSNYSAKDIDEAYEKACKLIGFDFVADIGSYYECSYNIPAAMVEKLLKAGVYLNPDFINNPDNTENYDSFYDDGDYIFDDARHEFIDVFISIIRLILPDFTLTYRDLEEERLFALEGAMY